MNVCVVGLGKIGLPVAIQYASKGLFVLGADSDPVVVAQVNAGRPHLVGEPGVPEQLPRLVAQGQLRATTDTAAAAAAAEVIVLLPPVLLDAQRRPDFGSIDAATEAVARGLRPGTLVLVETTVPVGSTRGRVGRLLERGSGLRLGRDFFLAYSPERVSSGTVFRDLCLYPKVVGGVDKASSERAAAFYRQTLDAEVLVVRDAETAEFAKLAESIYRDVNIALANELARAADTLGVDALEAFQAANSQPYSHLHQPGVGVGGHCIPVYPYFLIEAVQDTALTRLARTINDGMAEYAAERLEQALGSLAEKTVLVLGLAYRANVAEARYSSTFLLDAALRTRGARVLVHDPLFSTDTIAGLGLTPAEPFPPVGIDALIIQAFHDQYRTLDLSAFRGCRVVVDGRNALEPAGVEQCGMQYIGIGRRASDGR